MQRGGRENGPEVPAGARCILKPGVHELHRGRAGQVLPGQRDQVRAGFECRDVQAPGDQTARQLTGPAPDLEHLIAVPDTGDLTRSINEFVGIRRTDAVILARYLIEDRAVVACPERRPPRHSPSLRQAAVAAQAGHDQGQAGQGDHRAGYRPGGGAGHEAAADDADALEGEDDAHHGNEQSRAHEQDPRHQGQRAGECGRTPCLARHSWCASSEPGAVVVSGSVRSGRRGTSTVSENGWRKLRLVAPLTSAGKRPLRVLTGSTIHTVLAFRPHGARTTGVPAPGAVRTPRHRPENTPLGAYSISYANSLPYSAFSPPETRPARKKSWTRSTRPTVKSSPWLARLARASVVG